MKKYYCDVCGKVFGANVSMANSFSSYKASDFQIDAGMIHHPKENADICGVCYERIAKAQDKEVADIKKENNL